MTAAPRPSSAVVAPRRLRALRRPGGLLAAVLLVLVSLACDGAGDHDQTRGDHLAPRVGPAFRARVAASVASCQECHPAVVRRFLEHGMAYGLAPVETLPEGDVTHPVSGDRYRFEDDLLIHERPDGGRRVARVVGRYGAGVLDISYIGCELDGEGRPTGRLSFLPLEDVRGHGAVLAPFEGHSPGSGLDMPFNAECLSCHATMDVASLPGAAADPESGRIWPDNLLGADAFDHLRPMACEACHGPTEAHAQAMQRALDEGDLDVPLELTPLGQLPPARQRDVCSLCHLQGEGRVELAPIEPGGPQPEDFLARRPALVAARPAEDHPFVGQVQRLALSACFRATPAMTCTSCHDPHTAVARQGTADFDQRCLDCHDGAAGSSTCLRPEQLTVAEVTGRAARTAAGCVDCHVRRSQPFDLAHVTTANHWIRRRPPPPSDDNIRQREDPDGPLRVFDDGRLAAALATGEGQRWEAGLVAVAAARGGDLARARDQLEQLPPAGQVSAATGETAGLPALQAAADFHHLRALAHEALGQADQALAAYGRALQVDPSHPQAGLNGAALLRWAGGTQAALDQATALVDRYPRAEKPWNLRYLIAQDNDQLAFAVDALVESVGRWPNDPTSWQALGRLWLSAGAVEEAGLAFDQAWRLQPSLPGLAEDRRATGR